MVGPGDSLYPRRINLESCKVSESLLILRYPFDSNCNFQMHESQSGGLLSLMNPTGNLNNESFHYANGKMRIQRSCPEELLLKMGGNRHNGDKLREREIWLIANEAHVNNWL
jgi:hypothetical protein